MRLKGSVTLVEQNRQRSSHIRASAANTRGYCEVQVTVAIQIDRDKRLRPTPHFIRNRRLKGSVSIEVADRHKRRAVPRNLHGSTKPSVTFPQQNRYVEVRNNQIQVAVTIEVRRRHGLRCKVGGEINMRLKRPIAIAQ